MLSRIFGAILLASVGCWFGCSSKETRPALLNGDSDSGLSPLPQAGGRSDGGGGEGGGADAGALCNGLSLDGVPVVTQQEVAEAAPVPLGGTIADGRYILTKNTIYTGPGGSTGTTGISLQEAQQFAGQALDLIRLQAPNPPEVLSGTYATTSVADDAGTSAATRMTAQFSCPTGAPPVTFSYTATGSTLLEFVSPNEVLTYTAQ